MEFYSVDFYTKKIEIENGIEFSSLKKMEVEFIIAYQIITTKLTIQKAITFYMSAAQNIEHCNIWTKAVIILMTTKTWNLQYHEDWALMTDSWHIHASTLVTK
jgi:hypothetical protein